MACEFSLKSKNGAGSHELAQECRSGATARYRELKMERWLQPAGNR